MRQGERVITGEGQKGTIRYRVIDHYEGKKSIWYFCITPDNWNGRDKNLIFCPEKECRPESANSVG